MSVSLPSGSTTYTSPASDPASPGAVIWAFSGRNPSFAGPVCRGPGSGTSPDGWRKRPSSTVPSTTFIGGEPQNWATNRLAGRA